MTKAELVTMVKEIVAAELDVKISNKVAAEITDKIFTGIVDGIKKDEEVTLPHIGKIVLATSAARSGEMNGVKWEKPETFTAKLRLGKELKETLNS